MTSPNSLETLVWFIGLIVCAAGFSYLMDRGCKAGALKIPPHKITAGRLFRLAYALGTASALLTYAGTQNAWLALAVSFLCLTLHVLVLAGLRLSIEQRQYDEETPIDHRKVAFPEPRRMQEGVPYIPRRYQGFTLPQMLWGLAAFTGVLLFLPVVCFIITALMGAQEPRW